MPPESNTTLTNILGGGGQKKKASLRGELSPKISQGAGAKKKKKKSMENRSSGLSNEDTLRNIPNLEGIMLRFC